MSQWQPDIFEYVDYRAYLQAYYEASKRHNPAFSYRYFARRAGYSSPSFLRHVMRGERNLSAESVESFAKALSLDREEGMFFEALVSFDQAETHDEKRRAFERVASSRRFRRARRLDSAMFEYLSHWYYPVIREMTARADFREDAAWIAGQLLPAITEEQAAQALGVLLELELVVRDQQGCLRRGQPSIATEHEVRSMGVVSYHHQMLERAAASIEGVDREWRDIAAMTVCISPDTIAELKRRVHRFREILLELCDRDGAPTIVYQINTQLFPLSLYDEASDASDSSS